MVSWRKLQFTGSPKLNGLYPPYIYTKFIFKRRRNSDGADETADQDIELASAVTSSEAQHETDEEERAKNSGLTKRAILIFPQQFGGKPGDYDALATDLRARGHPVYLVRLGSLQWLSITKSAFSGAYWAGKLGENMNFCSSMWQLE